MNEEERFDPSRHTLADAAKRLKEISEKDYTARLAKALGRHEEEDTGELATGGVIEPGGIALVADGAGSPEVVFISEKARAELPPYKGGPLHNPGTPRYIILRDDGEMELTPHGVELARQLMAPAPSSLTDEIRAFIREEVHRTLYPLAEMANPHEHRRIEMTEQDGSKWRGVLYRVERANE